MPPQSSDYRARANAVGAAGVIHYVFPDNGGMNAADAAKAAGLKLGRTTMLYPTGF